MLHLEPGRACRTVGGILARFETMVRRLLWWLAGEGSNVSAGTQKRGDASPNSVGRSADRVALQMLGHSAELLRHFDERRFRKNLVGLPRQL